MSGPRFIRGAGRREFDPRPRSAFGLFEVGEPERCEFCGHPTLCRMVSGTACCRPCFWHPIRQAGPAPSRRGPVAVELGAVAPSGGA